MRSGSSARSRCGIRARFDAVEVLDRAGLEGIGDVRLVQRAASTRREQVGVDDVMARGSPSVPLDEETRGRKSKVCSLAE